MDFLFPSVLGESQKFLEKENKIKSFEILVLRLTGYEKKNYSNNFINFIDKKVENLTKKEIESYIANLKKNRALTFKKILPSYLLFNASFQKAGPGDEANELILRELYRKYNTYENEFPLFEEIRRAVENETTSPTMLLTSRKPQILFKV
jgi:hypothetical protein